MPKRQRDYRAEYLARKLRGDTTAGHYKPGQKTRREMSREARQRNTIYAADGTTEKIWMTRTEEKRAARYQNKLGAMEEGLLSPSSFSRWARRQAPIQGRQLQSDTEAALAQFALWRAEMEDAGDEIFDWRAYRETAA